MKTNKNNWAVGLLTSIVIIAIIVSILYNNTGGDDARVIKIGYVAPFSGNAAAYGEYATRAFKMGVEDFNNKSKDIKFEVIYEDGKCKNDAAVTAINKLITVDEVKYIIGGFCSGETLAMAPIADQNKVLMLSAGSTGPAVTNAGDFVFRDIASGDYSAKIVAKTAIARGERSIGIISENSEYSQSMRDTFKQSYLSDGQAVGAKVTFDETFAPEDLDFRTIITKAKNSGADAVYIVVQSYKNSAQLLKQMSELNYTPKIYAGESVIGDEALAYYDPSAKKLLEGAIFAQPKFDATNPKAVSLLERYASLYGTIEGPVPPIYLATHYDAPFIIGEAIRASGDDTTKAKNYLYDKIKNWNGALGTLSFDTNGDAVAESELMTVIDRKIVPLR